MNQSELDRYVSRLKDILIARLKHDAVFCFNGYFSPDSGDFCVASSGEHPAPVKFKSEFLSNNGFAIEPCTSKHGSYWTAIPLYSQDLNAMSHLEDDVIENGCKDQYISKLFDISKDPILATAGERSEAYINIKMQLVLEGKILKSNNEVITELLLAEQARDIL